MCNSWEKFLLTKEREFSEMAINRFCYYLAINEQNLFIDCKLKWNIKEQSTSFTFDCPRENKKELEIVLKTLVHSSYHLN